MLRPARQCSGLVALDEGTDLRTTTRPVGQGANWGAVVEEEGIREAVVVEAGEDGWSWAGAWEAGTGDWTKCEWLCGSSAEVGIDGSCYIPGPQPQPGPPHWGLAVGAGAARVLEASSKVKARLTAMMSEFDSRYCYGSRLMLTRVKEILDCEHSLLYMLSATKHPKSWPEVILLHYSNMVALYCSTTPLPLLLAYSQADKVN